MREPDFEIDGWCLDDGEQYHQDAPATFWIPDLPVRQNLKPGDFVKLIFRIAIDNPEAPVAFERMWVIVSDVIPGGYLGLLDNNPTCIDENEFLWSGIELPFMPRHVIDFDERDADSIAMAAQPPSRKWG